MQSEIRVSRGLAAAHGHTPLRLTWTARLAAAWAAAGGTAGGALVAFLVLAGRMHAGGSVAPALLLSVTGGCLGFVHGAVLGRISRRDEAPSGIGALLTGTFFGLLALAGSAALAVWLTTSAVLARSGQFWGWIALLAGAAAAAAVALLATRLGWTALEHAWEEWRERRLGLLLVSGSFLVLATVLLVLEPALPAGRGTLTTVGWLVVAAFATLWIATPMVVVALRAFVRDRSDPPR